MIKAVKGFNRSQKKLIKKRDKNQCQLPKCHSTKRLQVHHIVPRHYAWKHLKWNIEKINSLFNAITLCRDCHNYIHNGKNGKVIYWKNQYDLEFQKTAYKKTLKFIEEEGFCYVSEKFELVTIQVNII